jgi:hypothetical protein
MARLYAPATTRNTEPILNVLKRVLPEEGLVLEIASGTGEHVCAFAKAFPNVQFQPSDVEADSCRSIRAWEEELGLENALPPLLFSVTDPEWPIKKADAVICINMIHISPFSCCEGLMQGASNILSPGQKLYMYGPYKLNGQHTAPSNERFDMTLKGNNPEWGVRDLDDVKHIAETFGLEFVEFVEMPANNLSVIFRRT